jgi:hypothetical protein
VSYTEGLYHWVSESAITSSMRFDAARQVWDRKDCGFVVESQNG